MSTFNQYGEEIVGEIIATEESSEHAGLSTTAIWQLQRLSERDYDRREFGQEFGIVRYNASRSQSFHNGNMTRETARKLRDLLDKALSEGDNQP